MEERRCCVCKESEDNTTLHKCPMCLRWFCEDCEVNTSGRKFCSRTCSDYFFFGEH
jgi:hypothetical protein